MIANANQSQDLTGASEPFLVGPVLQTSVADELEAIFGANRGVPEAAHGASPVKSLAGPETSEGGRRTLAWSGAVACLLLGAVAVASATTQHRSPTPPVPLAPSWAAAELTVEPMPAPLVVKPLPAEAAAATPVLRPSGPRPVAVRKSPPPRRVSSSDAELSGSGACSGVGDDALARCLWPTVMQADQDLRTAYNRALDAGVPRSTMVSYRNRWSRLRHDAQRDPERVIAVYRSMAADLDDARSRGTGG